jgi:hypothetical protein
MPVFSFNCMAFVSCSVSHRDMFWIFVAEKQFRIRWKVFGVQGGGGGVCPVVTSVEHTTSVEFKLKSGLRITHCGPALMSCVSFFFMSCSAASLPLS